MNNRTAFAKSPNELNRSSTICVVFELPDHRCVDDLVNDDNSSTYVCNERNLRLNLTVNIIGFLRFWRTKMTKNTIQMYHSMTSFGRYEHNNCDKELDQIITNAITISIIPRTNNHVCVKLWFCRSNLGDDNSHHHQPQTHWLRTPKYQIMYNRLIDTSTREWTARMLLAKEGGDEIGTASNPEVPSVWRKACRSTRHMVYSSLNDQRITVNFR